MKYNGSIFGDLVSEIFAKGCVIESEVNVNRLKIQILRMVDNPRRLYKVHYAGRGKVVGLFSKIDGDSNWLDV